MKAQEKARKLWNDVKGCPSDYQEFIVKLEKRISLKKSRNAAGKILSQTWGELVLDGKPEYVENELITTVDTMNIAYNIVEYLST